MKHINQPSVLLSFDLEEFDIPGEYGSNLSVAEQMAITREGLSALQQVLDFHGIPATFFTTAFFAQLNEQLVRQLSSRHEIASHAFYHSRFSEVDIDSSRKILQNITGQPVAGFRMPRLAPVDRKLIQAAGYSYDASLNPTWIPGRYNNYRQPRTLFREDQLWVIPASVTPRVRLPLFWLSFKNLPLYIIKKWSITVLEKDNYLCLYFHPWEFADLHHYQCLPFYTRKPSGQQLLDKFSSYMMWLKTFAGFMPIGSYIDVVTKDKC